MNMKATTSPEDGEGSLKPNYLTFKEAQVLWPPDCPDEMLEYAISQAKNYQKSCKVGPPADGSTTSKNNDSRETDYIAVARNLKKDMDQKYKPYWHVICGKNFGCHAVHETRNFIFFTLSPISFMLYKAG